ncbi:hypothetical protein GCM10027037_31960 [Mucilaginibacter koreensis]
MRLISTTLRKTGLCLIVVLASIFSGYFAVAQTPEASHQLAKPPAGIVVDGNLHEWGDSLKYYNTDMQMGYNIANDHDNIYFAIRLGDRSEQMRVLSNGLTISINTRGKKKDTYSLTFPLGTEGSVQRPIIPPAEDGNNPQAAHEEMMRARLTSLRNIKVTGFKEVESDMITTSNTYGFKTAMSYDDRGYLLYEVAIPLHFFEHEDLSKAEWAFNFKVNGFKQTAGTDGGGMQGGGMGGGRMGGGMGRGGMGGGMRGGGMRGGAGRGGSAMATNRGEMSKSVDFWDKFYLEQ